MSRINFNADDVSADSIERISQATGIKDISSSSKLALLGGILNDELSNMASAYNRTTDGLYVETAQGSDLDLKAAQYGLYRKMHNSLYIDKADQILSVEPQVTGQTFGDTIREVATIRRGETLTLGTTFRITLAEDVVIIPSESLVVISGTINTVGASGFSTSEGDSYKIDTLSTSLGLKTNTLQVNILKPISLDGTRETDDQLRQRTMLAKAGDKFNSTSVLRQTLSSLQDISGYSVIKGKRGSGTVDIGITTRRLQEQGADTRVFALLKIAGAELAAGLAIGVSLDVFVPRLLELHLEYTTTHEGDDHRNVSDAIVKSFWDNYRFSERNSLSADTLEDNILSSLVDHNISIVSMSLIDPTIGVSILNGSRLITCPQRYFMFLDSTTITRA